MKRRTMAMTGLAALAAVSLAVAGCDSAAGGGGTTAVDAKSDAKQALVDATAKLATTTFKITLSTGGFSGSGMVDPAGKSSQLSLGGGAATRIDLRMVQNDIWIKVPGLPVGDGKWMHVDTTDLPADSRLNALGTADDPGGAQSLVKAITEVKSLGGGRYQGTLDVSKSDSSAFLTGALKDQSLGPDALQVPFEATVDDQGRLTSLSVDMAELIKKVGGDAGAGIAAAAGTVKMTFSDFGVKVKVQAPPADQVTELPAEMLKALGG